MRPAAFFLSLSSLLLCAIHSEAQTTPAPFELQKLRFQLISDKASYALDDPIYITLRFSYDGPGEMSLDGSRLGRQSQYLLRAEDEQAKEVPLKFRRPSFRGPRRETEVPLPGAVISAIHPFEQKVEANDWIAFEKAGHYTLKGKFWTAGRERTSLESEPCALVIDPTDETIGTARLQTADTIIRSASQRNSSSDRQTRFDTIHDLGSMRDKRAIPLLVRALSDEWENVAQEAKAGLLELKEWQLVIAELERVADAPEEFVSPYGQVQFAEIVRRISADRSSGALDPMMSSALAHETGKKMKDRLKPKLESQFLKSPPLEAAQDTVDAMQSELTAPNSLANWQRVFSQITALTPEIQERAAAALIQALYSKNQESVSRDTLVSLHDDLRGVAKSEKLSGPLRLAAILGLHRLGDDSMRDVVFRDAVSPETNLLHISTSDFGGSFTTGTGPASEILGNYRSKEIGTRLVAEIESLTPESSQTNWARWNSLLTRLRDFGRAVKPAQLRAVYQKIVKDAPPQEASSRLKRMLIESMAITAPDEAVNLIRKFPTSGTGNYEGRRYLLYYVLPRISAPTAHTLREEILTGKNEEDCSNLMNGLSQAMWAAKTLKAINPSVRYLRPRTDIVISTVPRLIQIFETAPSPSMRSGALSALSDITGIPGFQYPRSINRNPDEKAYVSQWKDWLAKQEKAKP